MLPDCVVLWAKAHGLFDPAVGVEFVEGYIEQSCIATRPPFGHCQHIKQAGLAGTITTKQPKHFALSDAESDVLDSSEAFTVCLGQSVSLN